MKCCVTTIIRINFDAQPTSVHHQPSTHSEHHTGLLHIFQRSRYTQTPNTTMKVYSLSLLSVTPASPAVATLLGTAQDLSSFSFYQRGSIGEFMTFFTKVSSWMFEESRSWASRIVKKGFQSWTSAKVIIP